MRLDILPIGLYQENSYVLHENGHVLFVDPGRFAKELAARVEKNEVVDGIVLTHGHEDHTGAADDLAEKFNCPVYMDMEDYILVDPKNSLSYGYDAPVYTAITPFEEETTVGTFKLQIIKTPGHTKGSVCIRYRNALFTGDTLFASDIGRTDLFGGSDMEMIASLQLFKQMPHDWQVFPGHGPASTIKEEILRNPYLQRNLL